MCVWLFQVRLFSFLLIPILSVISSLSLALSVVILRDKIYHPSVLIYLLSIIFLISFRNSPVEWMLKMTKRWVIENHQRPLLLPCH